MKRKVKKSTPKSTKLTNKTVRTLVKDLKELSAERAQYVRLRTRQTNQMKAIARRFLNKGLEDPLSNKELKAFADHAAQTNSAGGGVVAIWAGRDLLNEEVSRVEKKIKGIVTQLPIWTEWACNIKGIGELSLGNIIGGSVCESKVNLVTGEKYKKPTVLTTVGDYPNPARLWKRWGVGIVKGERQRRVKSDFNERNKYKKTGKVSGKQLTAIEHGFCPMRRAILWNVGDVFVKQGIYYRRRYDQEKARQLELHPEVYETKNGTKVKKNYTLSRAHNRAMRYVSKLFLTDLWNKWRELHGGGEFHKIGERE